MEQIDLHPIGSDKHVTGTAPTSASTERKYLVELLVLLFGLGSWFGVTTIFSQIPAISAPEDRTMPLNLSLTVQCGNAIALLYLYFHRTTAIPFRDVHAIILLAVGCVAAICMPFTYHIKVGEMSIALHIFTFIFATIGGFSSMVFMPYMKRFRGNYLFVFFFGQSLNDLLSNALAAIQGMWGSSECIYSDTKFPAFFRHTAKPLFQPHIAFMFIFPILAMSMAAFILLNKMKACRDELVADTEPNDVDIKQRSDPINSDGISAEVQDASKLNFTHLYMANVLIGFAVTDIFPFMHSLTCQQYMRRPNMYNLTISLIAVYNPLLWFVANLMPQQCFRIVRMCKVRVVFILPYLLWLVYGICCFYPLHSLLGLILLVSFWSYVIIRVIVQFLFCSAVHVLGDIQYQHQFHEIIHIRHIPLPKRQTDASARKEQAKSIQVTINLNLNSCVAFNVLLFSVRVVFIVFISHIPTCSMLIVFSIRI